MSQVSIRELRENLNHVRTQIAEACLRAGRAIDSVKLVAISKTKPIELIREAAAEGQHCFGENYVQEAVDKINQLPNLDWHFVGSLQTNKVKLVVGQFALIHSVDRLKLASSLNSAAETASVVQPILLQVRMGHEETKHGFSIGEMGDVIDQVSKMKNVSLQGLMSLPPLEENESSARVHFANLREALEMLRSRLPSEQRSHFKELSMGTSSDFRAAILEGATLVRVGTDIFGQRAVRT